MHDLRKTFLVVILLGLLVITACGSGANPAPTLAHDFTTSTPDVGFPTAMPTFTPTPAALGSPDNPVIMALVNASPSAEQQAALTDLAVLLAGHLQLAVSARFYNN